MSDPLVANDDGPSGCGCLLLILIFLFVIPLAVAP